VSITGRRQGHFSVTSLRTGPGGKQTSLAAGGLIRVASRAVTRCDHGDAGELVVPTPIVSSGAVDHLRGKIPASRRRRRRLLTVPGRWPGSGPWIGRENAATSARSSRRRRWRRWPGCARRRPPRRRRRSAAAWGAPACGRSRTGGSRRAARAAAPRTWPRRSTGPESGFNVRAVQQGQPYATTGWGLWQITRAKLRAAGGHRRAAAHGSGQRPRGRGEVPGRGRVQPVDDVQQRRLPQVHGSGGVATPGWTVLASAARSWPTCAAGNRSLSQLPVGAGRDGRPAGPGGRDADAEAGAALAARNLRKEQTAGLSLVNYYARRARPRGSGRRRPATSAHREVLRGTSAKWRDRP